MPLIGLIVAIVPLFFLGFAALYSYFPVGVAIVSFFAAILLWIPYQLRNGKLRQTVDLTSWPDLKWHFTVSIEKFIWPVIPLVIATAASLATLAANFSPLEDRFRNAADWARYTIIFTTIGLCALTPAVLMFFVRPALHILFSKYASLYLNRRFNRIRHKLIAVMDAENALARQYEAIGLHPPFSAREHCRDLVLDNLGRGSAAINARLSTIHEALEGAAAEMRTCAALHDQVQDAFERAKAVVLLSSSPTLLAELDRILLGLESDLLKDLFNDHKWEEAQEVLRLMVSELDTIRDAAARGGPTLAPEFADGANGHADPMPRSLEDAYRVLSVHASARKEVIKKVVDGQRQIWHPDLATDPAERDMRTNRIQCINAAWEIIDGKRAPS